MGLELGLRVEERYKRDSGGDGEVIACSQIARFHIKSSCQNALGLVRHCQQNCVLIPITDPRKTSTMGTLLHCGHHQSMNNGSAVTSSFLFCFLSLFLALFGKSTPSFIQEIYENQSCHLPTNIIFFFLSS